MPDLQVLTFVSGVPIKYAELNMPFNTNGTFSEGPLFVSGINKASQDLVKGLLTLQGTNNLAPNYGTVISSLLNSRHSGQLNTDLLKQIRYLLGYLNEFNAAESLSERIDEITSIKISQQTQSLTIQMALKTGEGTTATVSLT